MNTFVETPDQPDDEQVTITLGTEIVPVKYGDVSADSESSVVLSTVSIVDDFLDATCWRDMYYSSEVQDILLDIRNSLKA